MHVDAVTYIPGCTAEEQPDAVGFDELGRISGVGENKLAKYGEGVLEALSAQA